MRIKRTIRGPRVNMLIMSLGLTPELHDALKALIARQPDPKPSRQAMIRAALFKLVSEEGLASGARKTKKRSG